MKPDLDLETILQRAPRPEPPEDLFATLEKQIKLAPAARPEPPSALWHRCRRLWIPLAGLVGTAVIAVAVAMLFSASTTRSFAETLRSLTKLKSFHLVERKRDGPPRPHVGPGGTSTTPYHPQNPFVVSEYWFQKDPNRPSRARMRSTSPKEDVWRDGNRELTLSHETGVRSLVLNNAWFDFGGVAWGDLSALAEAWRLHELPAAKMPGARPVDAAAFWFGECRIPGDSMIYRLWVSRTNQLPVRFQFWSTSFPEVASEVLMKECEFSDFDADFPEETLALEITDRDLAQLGATRAELNALSDKAMSLKLIGEAGAQIIGTIKDDAGVRQVQGKLPFTIVHEQHGKLSFDFRMADGIHRSFGVQAKALPAGDLNLSSHIWGWVGTNWQSRIEAD